MSEEAELSAVVASCRETLGDKHPYTLLAISRLAQLLKAQGKLAEAEPLYREALAGCRETLGDKDKNTLATIGNMAELLRAQGKLAEATRRRGPLAMRRGRLRIALAPGEYIQSALWQDSATRLGAGRGHSEARPVSCLRHTGWSKVS